MTTRRRGRPAAGDRESINVRVSSAERLRYEERARDVGLTLSEWIRALCRRDAGLWTPDGAPIQPAEPPS